MASADAQAVHDATVALSRSHGHAPAVDILALVMQGRKGPYLDFTDPSAEHGSLVSPRSPLGQLIAEAFDPGMAPQDWLGLTGPGSDPRVVTDLLKLWRDEIMQKLARSYGVSVTGLPKLV